MAKIYNYQFIQNIKYKKLTKEELDKEIDLAKKGNQESFTNILCHMHKYLCYITSEFFVQGAEAQDVYQEGAIKLVNVIEKFDPSKGSFTTFAQSSIKKHIITTMNKEMALKRVILNSSYSLDSKIVGDDGEEVSVINMISSSGDNLLTSGETIDPLDLVQRDYEEYLVEKINESLSDMEKKVFSLRFLQGLSYKEVAKVLDLYKINKKTGKKTLDQKSIDNAIWRSRPKIKKVLEKLKINKQEKPVIEQKEIQNANDQKIQDQIEVPRRRNIHAHKDYSAERNFICYSGSGRLRESYFLTWRHAVKRKRGGGRGAFCYRETIRTTCGGHYSGDKQRTDKRRNR